MRFAVEPSRNGAEVRITVHGELDMHTGPRVQAELERAEREPPRRMVLDLSAVTFFDSTGLQIVLDADYRAREGGYEFALAAGDGDSEVLRVLELAKVQGRLALEGSPEG